MITKNKISDPLEDLQLDSFKKLNELLKINHHSPTSSSMPLGIYVYRYLLCTQEERRDFEGNANMAAGVVVGVKIPVVITSRSDDAPARLASMAAAVVALD